MHRIRSHHGGGRSHAGQDRPEESRDDGRRAYGTGFHPRKRHNLPGSVRRRVRHVGGRRDRLRLRIGHPASSEMVPAGADGTHCRNRGRGFRAGIGVCRAAREISHRGIWPASRHANLRDSLPHRGGNPLTIPPQPGGRLQAGRRNARKGSEADCSGRRT